MASSIGKRSRIVVYALTNEAFPDYVKIGKTTNLQERMRSLDTTGVPIPFVCEHAVEVFEDQRVEEKIHRVFSKNRVRKNREFFEVDVASVISAMDLSGGIDVTPKENATEDQDDLEALNTATKKRSNRSSFPAARVPMGSELSFREDDSVKVTVCGDRKVLFEGKETTPTAAATELLRRERGFAPQISGYDYFLYQGETIYSRVKRFREED